MPPHYGLEGDANPVSRLSSGSHHRESARPETEDARVGSDSSSIRCAVSLNSPTPSNHSIVAFAWPNDRAGHGDVPLYVSRDPVHENAEAPGPSDAAGSPESGLGRAQVGHCSAAEGGDVTTAPFTEVSPRPSNETLGPKSEPTKGAAGTRHSSCRGCLLFSRSIMEAGRDPVCLGFARTDRYVTAPRAHADDKEVRPLTEFKYACVGYSVYKQQQQHGRPPSAASPTSSPASSSSSPAHPPPPGSPHAEGRAPTPMDTSQLPMCTGLEVLALADAKAGDVARAPSASQDTSEDHSGATGTSPSPPIIRTPLGTVLESDFPGRFARSAGLIANKCASNLLRAAEAVKSQLLDVFQSGRDRSK